MAGRLSSKYRTPDTRGPVPMNDGERDLLRLMYGTRLRIFAGAFFTLFMLGILYGQRVDYFGEGAGYSGDGVAAWQMRCIGILVLEIPILSCGLFIFLKRVCSLKRDLADGFKYRIYHTVTGKQYFPITGQYFISLDDPEYMHYEVDAGIYDGVATGDAFPVFFTRYARYAFNRNGSYTVM